ncbi:MAG: helix-turn-helix transcriptional regulator [Ruminococcaceae bacterium]|nr:helix-turn-helix transcriptional regulator [Oscillospiraceae bacterium]
MSLKYKIDVLAELKNAGYNTSKLRKDKLLSESTIQKFRNKLSVSWENIETLCRLLKVQPGDIIEYVEEGSEKHE